MLLRRDGTAADRMRLNVVTEYNGPLDRRDCPDIGLAWQVGSTEVWRRVRMAGNKVKLNFAESEMVANTQKDASILKHSLLFSRCGPILEEKEKTEDL